MTSLVDSNVLLDLFTADPAWLEWSRDAILTALRSGTLAINPIVYAEVSAAFAHERELEAELDRLGIERRPLPYRAGFPAMRAFLAYRRRGGSRRSPLPDFYIGAHAQVEKLTLLTRDRERYRTYFPSVRLVAPE